MNTSASVRTLDYKYNGDCLTYDYGPWNTARDRMCFIFFRGKKTLVAQQRTPHVTYMYGSGRVLNQSHIDERQALYAQANRSQKWRLPYLQHNTARSVEVHDTLNNRLEETKVHLIIDAILQRYINGIVTSTLHTDLIHITYRNNRQCRNLVVPLKERNHLLIGS